MFQSKIHQQLKDEWYGRLKDSGFDDIEDSKGNIIDHGKNLRSSLPVKRGTVDLTISYYLWASEQLHIARFKCDRDRCIWELHCEGLSGSEISEKVNLERTWVNRVIQRVRFYLEHKK